MNSSQFLPLLNLLLCWWLLQFPTATEFAKQYGHTELLDLIAQSEQESREGGQDSEMLGTMGSPFPAHLPLSVLQRGVQSGKLLQGVFHASRENSRQGFVSVRGSDMRVLVKVCLREDWVGVAEPLDVVHTPAHSLGGVFFLDGNRAAT